jgi:hypothetical protein
MMGLAAGTRIWIVAGVTDMRRGFVGLSALPKLAKSPIILDMVDFVPELYHLSSMPGRGLLVSGSYC